MFSTLRGMVISVKNKPTVTSMRAHNYAFNTSMDDNFFKIKIEFYACEY